MKLDLYDTNRPMLPALVATLEVVDKNSAVRVTTYDGNRVVSVVTIPGGHFRQLANSLSVLS